MNGAREQSLESGGGFSLSLGVAWNGHGDFARFAENAGRARFVDEVLIAPSSDVVYEKAIRAAHRYTKVRVLKGGDTGIYDAYNKLIDGCQTSHICFHGIDDFVVQDLRLNGMEAFSRHTMVVFSTLLCSPGGVELGVYHHRETEPPIISLARETSPATPEVLYPTDVLKSIGGADVNFRIAGDADLYFRARANCTRVDVHQVIVRMLDGGASALARNGLTVYSENCLIAAKFHQRVPVAQKLLAATFFYGRYYLYVVGGERFAGWVTDFFRFVVRGRRRRFSLR